MTRRDATEVVGMFLVMAIVLLGLLAAASSCVDRLSRHESARQAQDTIGEIQK